MVYINSEGGVSERRKRSPFGLLRDFIVGVFDFVGLFFRTLTANPAVLEAERVSGIVTLVVSYLLVDALGFQLTTISIVLCTNPTHFSCHDANRDNDAQPTQKDKESVVPVDLEGAGRTSVE